VLPIVNQYCGGASVNRKLAALTSSCELQGRLGVPLTGLLFGLLLDTGMRIGRRSVPVRGPAPGSSTVRSSVVVANGASDALLRKWRNTTRLVQSLLSCRSNRNGTGVPAATRTRFGE